MKTRGGGGAVHFCCFGTCILGLTMLVAKFIHMSITHVVTSLHTSWIYPVEKAAHADPVKIIGCISNHNIDMLYGKYKYLIYD